jgi:hypothetical protein
MTNDDSEQIAAARSSTCGDAREASGASRCAKSSFGPIANRRSHKSRDRRCDRERNFPACKALETHKMAKESRFFASQSGIPAERPSPIRPARRTVGLPLTIKAFSPGRASGSVDGGLDRDCCSPGRRH